MSDYLATIKDVGTFQVEDIIDARSRSLGLVNPIHRHLGSVAVTFHRYLMPFAVVKRKTVESNETLATAEIETISANEKYLLYDLN